MSFPRYQGYKPSLLAWLGDIPSHWDLVRLSHLASSGRRNFTDGDWIESPFLSDNGVRLIQTGNIGIGEYREQGFRFVSDATFHSLDCTEVCVGDILICRLAAPVGRACLAPALGCKMITSVDVSILKPKEDLVPTFIVFLLSSSEYLAFLDSTCRGGTRDRVSRSFLGSIRLPIPPTIEQQAIAAFLNSETSKIDALVAEQRRLIELLKEKRQAVISHAVTKGLNPHVKMKPSGIDWLGDVPEHWEIRAFHHCVRIAEGQIDPKDLHYNELPLIAPNHIESRTGRLLDLETAFDQGAISGKYLCDKGDVIYSKIRPSLRKACIAPVRCLCSADMYPIKTLDGLENRFLHHLLLSEHFSAFAELESDRVAMPKINRESLKKVKFPIPPLKEQRAICDHLDVESSLFDRLLAETSSAITLLQERRTALISAAVTGKIDVRGFAPKEASA